MDELYELPPGEFTAARDELVRRLRKEGDREKAERVKALRRPTVAAWALNQLARRRRQDVERLLAAGRELRAAQEQLVAGGKRDAFRKAAERERELVAKLTADAVALAGEAGSGPSTALEDRIGDTLRAAAIDDGIAEELAAGRLTREHEPSGGFGDMQIAPASESRPQKSPRPGGRNAETRAAERRTKRARDAAAKEVERARKRAEQAQERLEHSRAAAEAARAELEAAERRLAEAERR